MSGDGWKMPKIHGVFFFQKLGNSSDLWWIINKSPGLLGNSSFFKIIYLWWIFHGFSSKPGLFILLIGGYS